MADPQRRLRSVLGLIVAASLTIATLGLPRSAVAADSMPAWHGGIDLYRGGVYSVQRSWLWCTAAGVQIVRNIVAVEADHTAAAQRRYFAWMRANNRYHLPLSGGVDPQGWAAGLRHFVDPQYQVVASTTFDDALRSAARRLRETNLPVALTVSHGDHGWILTGFTAAADPLRTASFKITSVRVTGPLYGLQSRNGYDMRPDTRLTPTQLRRFFTPWKYIPMRMVWDGRYVSIQPVPAAVAAAPRVPPSTTSRLAAGGAATGRARPAASVGPADDPPRDSASNAVGANTVSADPTVGLAAMLAVGSLSALFLTARLRLGGRRAVGGAHPRVASAPVIRG